MNDSSVRLEQLPPRRVARFRAEGTAPERDAWEQLQRWAAPLGLLHDSSRYPIFGFNNPAPVPERSEYGYEFWIGLGPTDEVGGESGAVDFPGGWYAVARIHGLPRPEVWRQLWEWVGRSPVRHRAAAHELERPRNPFAPESELEFELYLPVEARTEPAAGASETIAAGAIPAVRAFIAAINAHDVDALGALMTEGHTFCDSGGATVSGREAMMHGWRGYLAQFPDFTIVAESLMQDGPVVAVFGSWSATYKGREGLRPENAVAAPAAWRAVVDGGRIKAWRIFTDHTRTVEIVRRHAERTETSTT